MKIIFARPKDTAGVSRSTVEAQQEHSRSTVEVQSHKYKNAIIRLIKTIGEDWFASYELRELMSYKSKTTFRQNYLNPAIKFGYVRLQYPESPNVPHQKYGLTLKGKALYYGHIDYENDPQNDPQNDFEGQNATQRVQADPQKDAVVDAIRNNDRISRAELAAIADCSESTVKRRLKDWGIAWLGHPKTGHWVFVKDIR